MVVSLNPQIANTSSLAFKSKSNASFTSSDSKSLAPQAQNKKPVTGFLAKVAYAWINLSEGARGVVNGLVGGLVVGTAIAAGDKLVSLFRTTKDATFLQKINIFKNPTKGLTKYGKVVAPVIAAVIFAGSVISARLTANKRTANVDHQLYAGHRDK